MHHRHCEDCPCWMGPLPEQPSDMGSCRAEPPEIRAFDPATSTTTSTWPPAMRLQWCYYGRRLMAWRRWRWLLLWLV